MEVKINLKQATQIADLFGVEPNKDGYYITTWGKKTEEGLIQSIQNIINANK